MLTSSVRRTLREHYVLRSCYTLTGQLLYSSIKRLKQCSTLSLNRARAGKRIQKIKTGIRLAFPYSLIATITKRNISGN